MSRKYDIFKKLYYSQDYDTQLGGTRHKYQGAPGNNINAGDSLSATATIKQIDL